MTFHGVDVRRQFKRMRELAPDAYRAFLEFDGKAFAPGALDTKTKELIAVGIAHITQCPWCIDAHTARPRRRAPRTRSWARWCSSRWRWPPGPPGPTAGSRSSASRSMRCKKD
jgi:AhpD family alkylhydroperoxidase